MIAKCPVRYVYGLYRDDHKLVGVCLTKKGADSLIGRVIENDRIVAYHYFVKITGVIGKCEYDNPEELLHYGNENTCTCITRNNLCENRTCCRECRHFTRIDEYYIYPIICPEEIRNE